MQLSKLIINRLKSDTELRMKIAMELGVSENAIIRGIERGAKSKTLYHIKTIKVIEAETGLTESEIFEKEPA